MSVRVHEIVSMIVCVCVIENEIVKLSYHEIVGICVIETRRDSLLDS